jgi:hypothetical protein
MEEFRHPPVEIDLTLSVTPERAFAQRAYAALDNYSGMGLEETLGRKVQIPMTDRIDMPVALDATAEVAMRLVGSPVFQMSSQEAMTPESTPCVESSEYIVVELQYGELLEDEIEDFPEDDDYSWQSYVVVVIDAKQPDYPSVLDANTGKELSPAHLMTAAVILDQVCGELEKQTLDSAAAIAIHGELDTVVKDDMGYATFHPDEYIKSGSCQACSYEDIPCTHLGSNLN